MHGDDIAIYIPKFLEYIPSILEAIAKICVFRTCRASRAAFSVIVSGTGSAAKRKAREVGAGSLDRVLTVDVRGT